MKTLLEIRNNLYNSIPTGEIKAFELIIIIAQHLKELDEYIDNLPSITKQMKTANRYDAEGFLQTKDIWNHPMISDRLNKNGYEVADLMAEFANWFNLKTKYYTKEEKK